MATLQRLGPRKSRHEITFCRLTIGRVIGSRLQQFETAFPRLLHLLAHHPDFAMTHESAVDMSRSAKFNFQGCSNIDHIHYNRYIKLYMTTVATADNISLIFHLAEKVKTVRDAESDRYSEVWATSKWLLGGLKNRSSAYICLERSITEDDTDICQMAVLDADQHPHGKDQASLRYF